MPGNLRYKRRPVVLEGYAGSTYLPAINRGLYAIPDLELWIRRGGPASEDRHLQRAVSAPSAPSSRSSLVMAERKSP